MAKITSADCVSAVKASPDYAGVRFRSVKRRSKRNIDGKVIRVFEVLTESLRCLYARVVEADNRIVEVSPCRTFDEANSLDADASQKGRVRDACRSDREYRPDELIYGESRLDEDIPLCFEFNVKELWEVNRECVDWTPSCALFDDPRWMEEMEACFTFGGTGEEARALLAEAGVVRDLAFEKLCRESDEDEGNGEDD